MAAIDAIEALGRFLDFAGRATAAIPAALWKRPAAVARQFERVLIGTLPLVVLAGLSIGVVTWIQLHRLLVTYGVEDALPSVLAAAVLVETGPVLTALLVAGRVGAGLAAELGSMTLTEEIDARAILGSHPVPTLVAPRAIACALAVPLLTIVLDASALAGGWLTESIVGRLTLQAFGSRSLDFLWLRDIVPSTLKTALFGLLVGLVGCWTGLTVGRSTEAVGKAATSSVVRSMFVVFGANVLVVPLIQWMVTALNWNG